MAFPVAVAASVRSPGFYLVVNLLAGVTSPGGGALRACIIGVISAAGDLTADTEIRTSIRGADVAETGFGSGMPGHLAAKALFAEHPIAQVDIIGVAPPAGVAASGTFTFVLTTPPVLTAIVLRFRIAGRVKDISWNPGESITTAAAKVATAYTAIQNDLPCTVLSSVGVVTVAAKEEGTYGNDITISVERLSGTPADATCTASGANLTGGTLQAATATAIAALAGTEYDYILNVSAGNSDAETAAATSQPGLVKAHINTYNTGANARLQQSVFGLTGTLAAAKTGAAQQNEQTMQFKLMRGGLSLPAEVAGAEVGRRMRMESIDPTANANNTVYKATLYPPKNLTTGALTEAEREDAYQSGVDPMVYDPTGAPKVDRPITTHFKDTNSNADDRALDVAVPSGTYAFAKRLRASVPQQFQGAKLSANLVEGDDPLPPGTVEVREIQQFVIGEALAYVAKGWFDQAFIKAAIANDEFVARVNPDDTHQCDLIVPTRVSAAYLKTSAVVNAQ